jgi:hypothetical protein
MIGKLLGFLRGHFLLGTVEMAHWRHILLLDLFALLRLPAYLWRLLFFKSVADTTEGSHIGHLVGSWAIDIGVQFLEPAIGRLHHGL